jgi:type IV pilus assembly protein PilW
MIKRHRERSFQFGLTLVELMVAMAISLLLLAGVIQIFLSSRQSYQMQDGLSRLQENGRFAIDVLTSNLRHAGFKRNAWSPDDQAFRVDAATYGPANVSFSTAGQIVAGTDNNGNNGDTVLNGSDTISFRFQGSANAPAQTALRDCLNARPDPGEVTVNTLYVRSQDQELHCRSEDGGGDDQPLLDGIEGMQILYGVDTDDDSIANRYSTAATVNANSEWTDIVTVRIALLLSTVAAVANETDTATYTLLNSAAVGPFNDRLRRHVFTTTVALRNRLP